jgi:hypothetical protein
MATRGFRLFQPAWCTQVCRSIDATLNWIRNHITWYNFLNFFPVWRPCYVKYSSDYDKTTTVSWAYTIRQDFFRLLSRIRKLVPAILRHLSILLTTFFESLVKSITGICHGLWFYCNTNAKMEWHLLPFMKMYRYKIYIEDVSLYKSLMWFVNKWT